MHGERPRASLRIEICGQGEGTARRGLFGEAFDVGSLAIELQRVVARRGVALGRPREDVVQPRWFDGRGSLIVPNADEALVFFSGFAPLPEALRPYLATAVLQDTLLLRSTDADRPVWVYHVTAAEAVVDWQQWLTLQPAQFGEAAALLGYYLSSGEVAWVIWCSL